MITHTKGPWIVVHSLHEFPEFPAVDAVAIVADLVNNTWVIQGSGELLGDSTADAHLISAAPDMLDALLHIQHAIESGQNLAIAMRSANEAILKARWLV